MEKYLIRHEAPQVPPYEAAGISHGLTTQVAQFLFPLLVDLDALLDKRLVRTFVQIITVILTFRDRANGLLLSKLGDYLLSPERAPASTKRLSNLLHSDKWRADTMAWCCGTRVVGRSPKACSWRTWDPPVRVKPLA
ncbi:MAG: hypothetical protein NVSMB38_28680 [Ktedonobacteraceae bacterium]